MKLYIANNSQHTHVIIHAETEQECKDTFSEMLGYKDYKDMEAKLGKDIAKIDSELMYIEG